MALFGGADDPRRMTSGVTLRSSADLLAAVPYLLGFHPRDSVVVVAMRRERVLFAGRGDLPGPIPMGAMAARFVALLARDRADAVAVIGYGPPGAVTPAVDALRAALAGSRVFLLDAIRVEDGRYWSYVCSEPSCCSPEGQPFDAETSPVALSAVYHGQVALPDREALAAQVAPVGGAVREAMRVATLRADDRLCDLIEAATGGLEVLAVPLAGPDRTRLPPARHQPEPSRSSPSAAAGGSASMRRRPASDVGLSAAQSARSSDASPSASPPTGAVAAAEPSTRAIPGPSRSRAKLAFGARPVGEVAVAGPSTPRDSSGRPGSAWPSARARPSGRPGFGVAANRRGGGRRAVGAGRPQLGAGVLA